MPTNSKPKSKSKPKQTRVKRKDKNGNKLNNYQRMMAAGLKKDKNSNCNISQKEKMKIIAKAYKASK
jgi:hypothetical protein